MTKTESLKEALEATKDIKNWVELDKLKSEGSLGPVFKKNIYLRKLCNMLSDIKDRSNGTFTGFDELYTWYRKNIQITIYCHKVSTGEIVTL